MKDKEIIYKRVYIHNEEDLPEEVNTYITFRKGKIQPTIFHPDKDTYPKIYMTWLSSVDWYLQPKELPSEDEIKIQSKELQTEHGGYWSDYAFAMGYLLNKILE